MVYWLEFRTRNFQVAGLNLTAGHWQATLSKLLTYGVLRSTQPPTLRGIGMSSSFRATGEGLVWLTGRWYVGMLHRWSNCSLARAMDGRIMRCDIISSCQSAATSEMVNRS